MYTGGHRAKPLAKPPAQVEHERIRLELTDSGTDSSYMRRLGKETVWKPRPQWFNTRARTLALPAKLRDETRINAARELERAFDRPLCAGAFADATRVTMPAWTHRSSSNNEEVADAQLIRMVSWAHLLAPGRDPLPDTPTMPDIDIHYYAPAADTDTRRWMTVVLHDPLVGTRDPKLMLETGAIAFNFRGGADALHLMEVDLRHVYKGGSRFFETSVDYTGPWVGSLQYLVRIVDRLLRTLGTADAAKAA